MSELRDLTRREAVAKGLLKELSPEYAARLKNGDLVVYTDVTQIFGDKLFEAPYEYIVRRVEPLPDKINVLVELEAPDRRTRPVSHRLVLVSPQLYDELEKRNVS